MASTLSPLLNGGEGVAITLKNNQSKKERSRYPRRPPFSSRKKINAATANEIAPAALAPVASTSECPVKSRVALLARSDPAAAPPSLQYFRGDEGAQRITSIPSQKSTFLSIND
ncbi:MAG: hypothetical protein Q8P67_05025 [archaeon]|nr:hypothetical protein [archaeon]